MAIGGGVLKRAAAVVLIFLMVWAVGAQSGQRWYVSRTPHLWVAIRSDVSLDFFGGAQSLDDVRAAFAAKALVLERSFQQVERALEADYRVGELGRVPVLVYPDLEAYQTAANCLICAAHVGAPVDRPPGNDRRLSFGAHLNLDSVESTVLHEFVHIVDFTAVRSAGAPLWYEGLASYLGNRLLGPQGQPFIDILPQYLKLYQGTHGLRLEDYLTRPGYGRWTYNLGTHVIDLLVRRGGWPRFLEFYRGLRRPDLAGYDALLQRVYGMDLAELDRAWQAELDRTVVTEEAALAYAFKFDQIVVRWIYLRPVLKDPALMEQAYLSLWEGGHFNATSARLMRDYLANRANIVADAMHRDALLQNVHQLQAFVATYAESQQIEAKLEAALVELEAACRDGTPQACVSRYADIVHAFVRWN